MLSLLFRTFLPQMGGIVPMLAQTTARDRSAAQPANEFAPSHMQSSGSKLRSTDDFALMAVHDFPTLPHVSRETWATLCGR
jgi:hypothetical protein